MTKDMKPTIEDLQRDLAKADALAEQKSNFLATMSHEIRTPMQSVYGLLELIEQEKPDANIMTMVQTAKNSASGLLEILDDILDFAKMDADKMALDQFEVPVRTLIRGINEAISVKAQGKDLELLDDIADDVPFVIIGDPKRLRQILMNLMSNAIKFTKEGSVTIKVTTNCQNVEKTDGKICLRFEVIDTGIGMNEEVCSRLFTSFMQADNSTSRKYGGTGLGVSICKKLVEMMGGQIGVSSKEGKGSIFWFEIPTEEVNSDNAQMGEMPELDGISVISVEDHPQGAKEIKRSLESMGAHVESCSTCAEALELIMQRPFDVAVIDQGLPDGLGLDLIREIMEIRPSMGLVMYTVRDDAGLQHTLQSLGVTYLTKPASRIGLGEEVLDAASKAVKMNMAGPTKLLIAEDTESVRDVLRRQLKIIGVEATFVDNGIQALEAVQTGEYGILLTDLHMPEMDGYELTKTIREEDKKMQRHFPVIALTADVQMSQRQVYMKHGFNECMLKPVSLGQFRRLLFRWGLIDNIDTAHSANSSEKEENKAHGALDYHAIKQQMGELNSDTIEMLQMFVEMTKPLIDKIMSAQKDQDLKNLKELAHSLKGAARSACANRLGNIAAELQDKSEAGEYSPNLIEKIKEEFSIVEKEIQSLEI